MLALATWGAEANDLLPATVQEAMHKAQIQGTSLAAAAIPLHRGSRAWRFNETKPMQPASTMKLVTTVVALERLGANARGRTDLLTTGTQRAEVLEGDVYLRGGADPEFDLPKLWQLLSALREQGVQEIRGRLLQDRSLFEPTRTDLGVPPFDEAPEFPYNGIPDALHLEANLLRLSMRSDGQTLQARTVPALPGIELSSAMTLNERPCADWDEDWQAADVRATEAGARIELRGAFPRNCVQEPSLSLIDRVLLTDRLVRVVWQSLGGRIEPASPQPSTQALAPAEARTPADARLIASVPGRAWAEVARGMNKRSDNPITRLLLLSLGAQAAKGQPGANTLQSARAEVARWFDEKGIGSAGIVMDNGSGLSRSERISAWQLARMFEVVHGSMNAPDVLAGLPVAGVDGTLRRRFREGPAFQRARLKTGTLRNVVALAGYVPDERGRPWAVAVLVNDERASHARPVLDAFVNWVAEGGVDAACMLPWPQP
jgi:D-alanyl-D-alanine carboxypeptidase/D-alanyl-D-alanine-endopeptidase (penicillin-binding protein 4)